MKNKFKKLIGILLIAVMLFSLCTIGSAAGAPKMELVMEDAEYAEGDIVKAEIYVKNADFNTAGFSLKYDTSIMSAESDAVLSSGYMAADSTSDKAAGTVSAVAFSMSKVSAGADGVKIAEISFKLLKDAKPVIEFAVNGDTVDFKTSPFCILYNGTQPDGAEAVVTIKGEAKAPVNPDDGNNDDGNNDDGNQDDGNQDDGNKDDGNKDDGNQDDTSKDDDASKDDGSSEKPKDENENDKTDEGVKTGDEENIFIPVITMVIALSAIFLLVFKKKQSAK